MVFVKGPKEWPSFYSSMRAFISRSRLSDAIAGALLGAVYGRNEVPLQWLDRILACRPISGLAGVTNPRPDPFWPVDALWIAERLLWLGRNVAAR